MESLRNKVVLTALSQQHKSDPSPYWLDVLGPGPWPSEWCGAFALWVLHQAGLAQHKKWVIGKGFISTLPDPMQTTRHPQPGDIAYFKNNQHQAIVADVQGNVVTLVNGNGSGRRVTVTKRPVSDAAAYYSIQRFIDQAEITVPGVLPDGEVSALVTPRTADQARASLRAAWPGLTPNQEALFLAHLAIETAQFQSIVRHNIGNLIADSARKVWTGPFWRPSWYAPPKADAPEKVKWLHEQMLLGKQPSGFRGYASVEEGFRDWAKVLQSAKYAPLRAAESPEEYVLAWKSTGYTPDLNVPDTLPNLRALATKYGYTDEDGLGVPPDAGAVALWILLIGGGLWALKKTKNG